MSEEKKNKGNSYADVADHRTWLCQGCHYFKIRRLNGQCFCQLWNQSVYNDILEAEWCDDWISSEEWFGPFHEAMQKAIKRVSKYILRYYREVAAPDLYQQYDEWRERHGL